MDDSIRILVTKDDKKRLKKRVKEIGYATVSEFFRGHMRKVLEHEEGSKEDT